MANDRPTAEELAEKERKIAEEAESMADDDKAQNPIEEEEPKTEDDEAEPSKAPDEEEEKKKDDKKEDSEEGKGDDKSGSDEEEEVDYKKKYSESTREAQILQAKNKKLSEVMDKASQVPDPTEEELKKEFPDWDDMSDTEKRLSKSELKNNRRFAAIEEATREFKDIDVWIGKVDGFIDDPKSLIKYPELEGKVEQFKTYATKQSHRGVDFETLVHAFLHVVKAEKKSNKGQMFEQGNGGPNDKGKPKTDKLTIEQAAALKKTNFELYKQKLKAGKIESGF